MPREKRGSPIVWLVATWPNGLWLNCLAFASVVGAFLLYYFEPADLWSPLPISVGAVWIVTLLGRVVVYVVAGTEVEYDALNRVQSWIRPNYSRDREFAYDINRGWLSGYSDYQQSGSSHPTCSPDPNYGTVCTDPSPWHHCPQRRLPKGSALSLLPSGPETSRF